MLFRSPGRARALRCPRTARALWRSTNWVAARALFAAPDAAARGAELSAILGLRGTAPEGVSPSRARSYKGPRAAAAMQLYSSVCTHYPAGTPGPTAAAPPATAAAAFKVSLQSASPAAAAPEPDTGERPPAAATEPREAAAAAAMPAFSACFERSGSAAAPPGACSKPQIGRAHV